MVIVFDIDCFSINKCLYDLIGTDRVPDYPGGVFQSHLIKSFNDSLTSFCPDEPSIKSPTIKS
ncbi:hypothetical protein D3C81_1255210 [compost metagenome]